ncbi:MAG: terpene synthase family protein [Mongoliitalea sp.]
MKMTIDPISFKSFLDEIMTIQLKDVIALIEYLEGEKLKKGTVLRKAGENENQAYLVMEGTLALYCPQSRLIRPFFRKEVAFDMDAYFSKSPSENYLIVKENAKLIKVSRKAESLILNNLSHLKTFSEALIQSASASNQKWMKISQMHYSKALPLIKKDNHHFFKVFNSFETASLLQVNRRTLSRFSRQLLQSKHSFLVKAMENNIFNYPFPSECHPQVDHVHSFALEWAIQHKLFFKTKTRLIFDTMKMPYLSCRLYPDASLEKAIWIGKFFVWLFFMDDFTDNLTKGKKEKFWEKILFGVNSIVLNKKVPYGLGKIALFWKAFDNLWNEFTTLASEKFIVIFEESIYQYILANRWEARNLDKGTIPSMVDYIKKRPFFSGGNMALDFSLFVLEDVAPGVYQHWSSLANYKKAASNLIFKSNDLLSYQKEKQLNDYHNLISQLQIHRNLTEEQAINAVIEEHAEELKKFLETDKLLSEAYSPKTQDKMLLMKNIKYQIAGAVEWSMFDTKRYIDF